MDKTATSALNRMQRISLEEINNVFSKEVLLYVEGMPLFYKNGKIYTQYAENLKDLLQVIKIKDAYFLQYDKTNVFTPRTYAEAQSNIPQHISVQCLFFHQLQEENRDSFSSLVSNTHYGKTDYDSMWIGNLETLSSLSSHSILYLMNRQVGGWDGSLERPVIELLCSGGHLPALWNSKTKRFETLSFEDLLSKEIQEELGLKIDTNRILRLGGFHNKKTNELVVLCALFVSYPELLKMISFSKENTQENIQGIYVGDFAEVMCLYQNHPEYFAGGKEASFSNFSSELRLMRKIRTILK